MSDIDFFEHEEHVSSKICDVSICKSLIKEPHELKLEYCQQRFEWGEIVKSRKLWKINHGSGI